jgi:transcriptional regulator of aromatic amino acid metabolism
MEEKCSRHLVKAAPSEPSAALAPEEDISLAALVDVPVLITGPAAACRELACELDRRSTSPVGAVEVIDCRSENALRGLAPDEESLVDARILLLQEVHALSPDDQLRLTRELDQVGGPSRGGRRILASSSVPLFDRVVDQLFDENLYYRLNVIHIVIHPNR